MVRIVNTTPKYRRRRMIAASVSILLGIAVGYVGAGALLPVPHSPILTGCESDEPCWDCTTMGDKVCDPISVRNENGTNVVVDARGNVLGIITD